MVTRGPVYPFSTLRLTVAGVQSISTSTRAQPLYSLWMPMPWAVPGAIGRPQLPALAALSSTALHAGVAHERAAELVGVLAHRLGELVDHQLLAAVTSGL